MTPTSLKLPLRVLNGIDGYSIRDFKGRRISQFLTKEEAEQVATAVNAHTALMEALDCATDLDRFETGNCGTRNEITEKWLEHIKKRFSAGKHAAHAAWTQSNFRTLPGILRHEALKLGGG